MITAFFIHQQMIITIILLSLLICILIYTNYNLLLKNEKSEDIIFQYENYINNVSNIIDFSDKKLKEIDSKETFKSDDEIGWFFNQIQYLQTEMNNFKIIKDKEDGKK